MKKINKYFLFKNLIIMSALIAILLSATFSSANELPPTTEWKSDFGAYGATYAAEVVNAAGQNDGYILIGSTCCDYDIYVIRTDSEGNLMQGFGEDTSEPPDGIGDGSIRMGGTGVDKGTCVQQAFDKHGNPDGFIVLGSTYSYGTGSRSMFVTKLGEDGIPLPYSKSPKPNVFGEEEITDKYGTYGVTIISNITGGSYTDPGYIEQTDDEGYAIAGIAGGSPYNMYLVKLTDKGNFESNWGTVEFDPLRDGNDGISAFPESAGALAYGVTEVLDGNGDAIGYILIGDASISGQSGVNMCIARTDINGILDTSFGNHNPTDGYSTFGLPTLIDRGRSVKQTFDQYGLPTGFILGGSTVSYGNPGVTDLFLVKTDQNGVAESGWGNSGQGYSTFGGDKNDNGYSVLQVSDGGYAIAGGTQSYGQGGVYYDGYLLKTDSFGTKIWDRVFMRNYSQESLSAEETTDGGFVLSRTYGMELIKVSPPNLTTIIFEKSYGGESAEAGFQTSDGGYIGFGKISRIVTIWDEQNQKWIDVYDFQFYAVKTDEKGVPDNNWGNQNPKDGTFIFGRTPTVNGGGRESGYDIIEVFDDLDNSTGFLLAGETNLPGGGDRDLYLARIDTNGELVANWGNTDISEPPDGIPDGIFTLDGGRNESDCAYSVKQLHDKTGFIVAGETYSYTPNYTPNIYLVKLDNNGGAVWAKESSATGIQYVRSVVEHSVTGEFFTVGTLIDSSFPDPNDKIYDMQLTRFDSSGNKTGSWHYGGAGWSNWDSGEYIIESSDNKLVLFGTKSGGGTSNFYILKVDTAGSVIWFNTIGSSSSVKGYSVKQLPDDSYIGCGRGTNGAILTSVKSDGTLNWVKQRGVTLAESYAVDFTDDNGLIFFGVGDTVLFPGMYFMKTDINGNIYD